MQFHSLDQKHISEYNKLSQDDFDIYGMIAEGSYAEVYEAYYRKQNVAVVLKKIHKESIIQQGKQDEIYVERYILQNYTQHHQGMIQFHGCFQDLNYLYFVIEHCPYGDLGQFISHYHHQAYNTPKLLKQYIYQITLLLVYLHDNGIVHLDLKPSNLVIDMNYNLKLIDFSTCYFYDQIKQPQSLVKSLSSIHKRQNLEQNSIEYQTRFVGTAEYVSPEMLEYSKASKEADLWSLGCIIYEMYHNKKSFTDETELEVFNKIMDVKYEIDPDIPNDVQDLINQLIQFCPADRLGAQSTSDILDHEFFQDEQLKQYTPWLDLMTDYQHMFIRQVPLLDSPFRRALSSQKITPFTFTRLNSKDNTKLSSMVKSVHQIQLNQPQCTIIARRLVQIPKKWSCFNDVGILKLTVNPNQLIFLTILGRLIKQFKIDNSFKISIIKDSHYHCQQNEISQYFVDAEPHKIDWVTLIKQL